MLLGLKTKFLSSMRRKQSISYLITLGLEEEQVLLNLLERNGKSVSQCAGTVFITALGNLYPILWPAKKDMS